MSSSSQYKQRAVWGWGTTFDAEEARAFLAQRVALYARLIGLFFSLLYAAGIVLAAAPERIWAVHLHVAKLANLVVVAIAFGVWWLVRRPGCPDLPIMAGDAAIPLVLSLSVAVAAPFIPPGFSLAMSFRAAARQRPRAHVPCGVRAEPAAAHGQHRRRLLVADDLVAIPAGFARGSCKRA